MFKSEFWFLEDPVVVVCEIRQFILDEVPFENLVKTYTVYNARTHTFACNTRVTSEPLKFVETQLTLSPCPILVGDP